jgi:hypothetical protein
MHRMPRFLDFALGEALLTREGTPGLTRASVPVSERTPFLKGPRMERRTRLLGNKSLSCRNLRASLQPVSNLLDRGLPRLLRFEAPRGTILVRDLEEEDA